VTVWSATYDAFGRATVDSASTVTNNLRYPGQYYDAETGLHYNWNRYYDPVTGRYSTSDPIGLEGGINEYVYAIGRPIYWIDPYGLNIGTPGTAEGFIPVWGSGREAINDFQCGRWGWGIANTVLAITDATGAGYAARGIARGAWKVGSHAWKRTREWYGETRSLPTGTQVHHWLITQASRLGKRFPGIINQPWNLLPIPLGKEEIHRILHGKGGGYDPIREWWHGTPVSVKAVEVSAIGRGVEATAKAVGGKDCGC